MKEIENLVIQARQGNITAFSILVDRFQNMAYGYGFSLLGDFHLAQDATQEAFIDAYRNLAQLREPAAFAGWFRRVVFKHCDRFLRERRHLATVPVDETSQFASEQPGPAEIAERNQLKADVLEAIRNLPEHERTATSLYYIDGYSQREVADFLEIPEKTVKSRLYSSRKRLKERLIEMVDKTMKASPLPEDFTKMVAHKVLSQEDLQEARRHLANSYHGKREPESFMSVKAAQEADIYVVTEAGMTRSAGYYGEMEWGIGETILTAVRPRELAGEASGVPDPVFAKAMQGCFLMAKEKGRALAILHGSMYDHGFCGLVPSFYYCVATLPVETALNVPTTVEDREVTNEAERQQGLRALLQDPFAAKITAFLGGGSMHVLEKNGKTLEYFNSNPGVFEKAGKAKMEKPFGYVNNITVKSRDAALAVLRCAAKTAKNAGDTEIRILESHATVITQTILSLGGTYLMRPSCPICGLDAEMAVILDFQELARQLTEEFRRRLKNTGFGSISASGLSFSIEMEGAIVGFVLDSGTLKIVSEKQKVHCILPRWILTRLCMGYYSGADVLRMGPIPWDRSDGVHPDDSERDMQQFFLPEKEAMLFRALFPKLWPCSLPDPDVWPWVIGEEYPRYQHEKDKSQEMKSQIDALRFPWLGY